MRLTLVLVATACGSPEPLGSDGPPTPGDPRPGDPGVAGDPRVGADASGDTAGDDTAGGDSSAPVSDFSGAGPFNVSSSDESITVNGCVLAYTLYVPVGSVNAPLVVLGHGFQRGRSNMADLATRAASWGARVAAPDYCHSSIIDTDHPQNGLDAAALSAEIAGGAAVLHAGYSAGGASAFVAAANDTATVGVMGLDAVDSGGAALAAAAALTVPTFGLVGPSSSCNDNNNGVPLYPAANGWSARVVDAGHCDFESPSGFGCEILCGTAQAGRQALVVSLFAAYVAWVTALDATGADWVLPTGATYGELVAAGTIASN